LEKWYISSIHLSAIPRKCFAISCCIYSREILEEHLQPMRGNSLDIGLRSSMLIYDWDEKVLFPVLNKKNDKRFSFITSNLESQ